MCLAAVKHFNSYSLMVTLLRLTESSPKKTNVLNRIHFQNR